LLATCRAPERKTPAGTPEDPYRFGGVLPDKQFHPSSSPAPEQPKFHHRLVLLHHLLVIRLRVDPANFGRSSPMKQMRPKTCLVVKEHI
jgi:hypothetical protein